MPASLGQLVLRRCGLLQDTLDAFGREIELSEGDATVECFGVASDQGAAKPEAADALEQHRSPMLSGTLEV